MAHIRGLWRYTRQVTDSEPLESLANAKVAIDAHTWLSTRFPSNNLNDFLHCAVGGLPLTLTLALRAELTKFRDASITPVFVFPGLTLPHKDRPTIHNTAVARASAWEAYYNKDNTTANSRFRETEKSGYLGFSGHIVKLIQEFGFDVVRAPYSPSAQLAYMLHPPKGQGQASTPFVHAVFGANDLFLYGVGKIITNIYFEEVRFDYVDIHRVLAKLKDSSFEFFFDACLLAGHGDLAPTLPTIEMSFDFNKAMELVRENNGGVEAIIASIKDPAQAEKHIDQFQKAKCVIYHGQVFDISCSCEPRHKDLAPADLHLIVGNKLPDEIYYLLFSGAVSTQVLNNIITGVQLEIPPSVDTEEYREVLTQLMGIRTKTLALVTYCLADHPFKKKNIVNIRWFDTQELPIKHNDSEVNLQIAQMQWFKITDEEIKTERDYQQQQQTATAENRPIGLSFLARLQAHKTETLQDRGLFKQMSEMGADKDKASSSDALLGAILAQALEWREFITSSGVPTAWGKALALGKPQFDQESFIVLELLRLGKLSSTKLRPIGVSPNVANGSYPSSRPELALLSRVLSLMPFATKSPNRSWAQPMVLDFDLMAFNSITRTLFKTMHNLLEMLLLNSFLSKRSNIPADEYSRVSHRLPFFQENAVYVGLLAKLFFNDVPSFDYYQQIVDSADPSSLRTDLENAASFWQHVFKMVTLLHDEKAITDEVHAEFIAANQLFESKSSSLLALRPTY